jgi:hypothetical protein
MGDLILTEFFTQLTEKEQWYAWFQQAAATARTTDNCLVALEDCSVTIINHDLWPAHLPDLAPNKFYFLFFFLDIYRKNPHAKEALKENMWREILEVLQEELWVISSLFKWYRKRESVCACAHQVTKDDV